MALEIKNNVTSFFIVGFSDLPDLRIPLFIFFISVYILTLIGNILLVLLICLSPSLHTPMYFFLCNLSALDIIYTSVTSPKLMDIFATNNRQISFSECIVQLYFFVVFWNTEYFLLTAMSYDRFVAICKPLHYTLMMSRRVRIYAATGTWLGGMVGAICPTTVIATAVYHSSHIINHFFCDIKALQTLSSGDTTNIQAVILIQGISLVMTCFILTLISYGYIVVAILKISSTKGKYKTFSTCALHLTVVSIFYALIFDLYMRPKETVSLSQGKILTVLYVYIIPLLNPVIYSFRNKDVKEALKKLFINVA
ncbi:olfactory receptor 5AR1-like [Pelodytes ibericus]